MSNRLRSNSLCYLGPSSNGCFLRSSAVITRSSITWYCTHHSWQIRKMRVAHAPGMPGTFSPPPRFSDSDMHHGTCVTYVSRCMLLSLTSGFLWSRWRGNRSRQSRCMHNPQFYVSGKRPMVTKISNQRVTSLLYICSKTQPTATLFTVIFQSLLYFGYRELLVNKGNMHWNIFDNNGQVYILTHSDMK